ncbi:MAG TPA: hypothetical protein VLX29_11695 [Nitrospirota bacterium]|nr:hypothetical protein [Nitrospirota bacterium]
MKPSNYGVIIMAVFLGISLIEPQQAHASDSNSLLLLNPSGERESTPGVFVDDLIKDFMNNHHLEGPALAGQFPHQRVEITTIREDTISEISDLYYQRGWSDGLPIVPPTPERVRSMLRGTDYYPTEVIGVIEPMRGIATVEKIAINAVMAGAKPTHLPVIIAAIAAIADPEFDLYGVVTTDESVTPLLIINGPVIKDLNINYGFGALGPGWQSSPNSAIGRAVRMVVNNIGGAWPGIIALSGIGQPGKYTLCIAENEEANPWSPLNVELGFKRETSIVTAMRAESAYNVYGSGLTELASVMGTLGSRMSARRGTGSVAVLLGPYTAKELATKGWTKLMVKNYLWEHGRIPLSTWNEQSYYTGLTPEWAKLFAEKGSIPVVAKPQDIVLFVAGSGLPIPQHVYFPTWVQNPGSGKVTKEIKLPVKWNELIAEHKGMEK